MIKMVEIAEKQIKTVDLKIKDTGEEIKSIEDLGYSQEGTEALNQVAGQILRGVKLGKN